LTKRTRVDWPVALLDGRPAPIEGGRRIAWNHNPAFSANDEVLSTGVRVHSHVAVDYLSGAIEPAGSA
jgi:hypothetical protein